jgi:hypothetical protein
MSIDKFVVEYIVANSAIRGGHLLSTQIILNKYINTAYNTSDSPFNLWGLIHAMIHSEEMFDLTNEMN